jgi:hypothetical protein
MRETRVSGLLTPHLLRNPGNSIVDDVSVTVEEI